mmetsp:Transcript_12509/g.22681  ORF Transcript_12509/g.22681 Transcript_12509/m.22681 type:complete len:81 (-) Transcript_12509:715-957(-)
MVSCIPEREREERFIRQGGHHTFRAYENASCDEKHIPLAQEAQHQTPQLRHSSLRIRFAIEGTACSYLSLSEHKRDQSDF